MLPSPTDGTASSCFVPFANESSPLPGARSWPLTRFGAVTVQTLLTTVLHQSVPVLLTRFPSVLWNVLPVRFPLDAATKKIAKTVVVIASRRRRPKGRPRSRRGRIRSPPVRATGSRPPPERHLAPGLHGPQTVRMADPLFLQQRRITDSSPRSKRPFP